VFGSVARTESNSLIHERWSLIATKWLFAARVVDGLAISELGVISGIARYK
jgi:hypothetical protein